MNGDAIRRLWHRLQAIVARARMLLFDDSGPVQLVQVRIIGDEVKDQVPRMADYGFVSMPPAGSDAVLVFLSGERSSGIIIATNNQTFRMRNLGDGEVAIHDDKGRFVLLAAAGIHVQGKDDPITVETTSNVTATAGGDIALHAVGKITLQAPSIDITTTTLTIDSATITTSALSTSTTAASVEIVAEVALTGGVELTGALGVVGATTIAGDTSIAGALSNNGHDIGEAHQHAAGSLHAGGTAITGVSGGVTP